MTKLVIQWRHKETPEVIYGHAVTANLHGTAIIIEREPAPGSPTKRRVIPFSSILEYTVER